MTAAAILLTPMCLTAQQPIPIKPDSVRAHEAAAMMGPMMQQMAPMMSQMAAMTLEGTLAALAKPENAERLADFTKNYYDALVRRGFTKEQALQIVMAVGVPHPGAASR
jgi:hypothetical protein